MSQIDKSKNARTVGFRHARGMARLATTVMTLASALALAGCSAISEPRDTTAPIVANEPPVESQPYTSVDQTVPHLRGNDLMGRSPGRPDVSLIGMAASDLRQHTTLVDGADFDPTIDPSGKSLAFASTRQSRNSHLYVKNVKGATITQITDGPSNEAQPCFDPSGTRLAFASDRAGHWDIWVVDISGRNPIQISNDPMPEMHPSWSPDGRHIAYCKMDATRGVSTIWVADIENPGVKRLIGEGMFPTWSPKGDQIAYQRARARGSHWFSIWTVQLKDDEVLFPTEVAARPDSALITPAWSPEGTQLTFSVVRQNDDIGATTADIGIIDADGRGFQRVTTGESENHGPAWGADGRIYFSSRTAEAETIWSVKPFRPPVFENSPSATSSNTRRAALAEESEE